MPDDSTPNPPTDPKTEADNIILAKYLKLASQHRALTDLAKSLIELHNTNAFAVRFNELHLKVMGKHYQQTTMFLTVLVCLGTGIITYNYFRKADVVTTALVCFLNGLIAFYMFLSQRYLRKAIQHNEARAKKEATLLGLKTEQT